MQQNRSQLRLPVEGVGQIELEQFVSTYGASLLRFAYLVTQDGGRAEDLVQEALSRCHSKLGSVAHPEAYVRKAIVNGHLSWRRRRASTEIVGEVPDRHARVADVEAQDLMWRLLRQLPRRQQVVLALRYYEGLSDPEIADVLGCAAGTVRSLASRAFDTLRAHPQLASVTREEQR